MLRRRSRRERRNEASSANRGKLRRACRAWAEELEGRALLSFGAVPTFNAGVGAVPTATGDFNGDGKGDVVSITAGAAQVGVSLGNGDGTFQPPFMLAVPAAPNAALVADVNGDGKPDLLVGFRSVNAAGSPTEGISAFLSNGDGSFQPAVNSDLGTNTFVVQTADLNHDGKADLLSPLATTGTAASFLGKGDGTFGAPIPFANAAGGARVTTADLNGDGIPDAVIADSPIYNANATVTYAITTELGNGDGTFRNPLTYNLYTSTFLIPSGYANAPSIQAVDLNGDGRADVAVAIDQDTQIFNNSRTLGSLTTIVPQPGPLQVLLSNPDGSLQAPLTHDGGNSPFLQQAVDVNGDGRPDLVVANPGADTVYLNAGGGTLGNSFGVRASGRLLAGDFNGDGHEDFLSGEDGKVLLGNGDGSLQGVAYVAAGNGATDSAVADVNRDGKPDLVETNTADGTVSVMLGLGNGAFLPQVTYSAGTAATSGSGPRGVAVADFTGDGIPDIALADEGAPGEVAILAGNGDGTFQPAAFHGTAGASAFTVAAADFNGDGVSDLLLTNPFTKTVDLIAGGTFQAEGSFPAGNEQQTAVGDFNGDGRPDFAVTDVGSVTANNNVSVFLNKGGFAFSPGGAQLAGFGLIHSMTTGDFNRDGKTDLAVTTSDPTQSQTGPLNVLYGNGDGTLQPPLAVAPPQAIIHPQGFTQPFTNNPGTSLTSGDMNADGIPDLVVNGVGTVGVVLGRGDGGFYPPTFYASAWGVAGDVAVADVNGDGRLDIAEVDNGSSDPQYTLNGAENVLLNNGGDRTPTFGAAGFRVSAAPVVTEDQPFSVTVTAVDSAGNPVPGFLGTVYLSLDRGMATPYTFTAADAGSHVFTNVDTVTTGGAHVVSAAAPFLATGSASVTAAPGSLRLTAPANVTAATAFALTVSAVDALGNPWTNYSGLVNVTSTDPKMVSLSRLINPGDGGTFTFPASPGWLTMFTGGQQTITATGPFVAPVTTTTFVSPGRFSVKAPATAVAGAPIAVTVSALDALGNVLPDFVGSVILTGTASPISYTFTAADAGVHTFTTSVTSAGPSMGILAQYPSFLPPYMNEGATGLSVTPATTSRLAVVVPNTNVAGAPLNFTVVATDAFGNVTPGYTGTINFADATPGAVLPGPYTFTAADAGSHAFSALLETAGVQSLLVNAPADSMGTNSTAINVLPGAATTFTAAASNTNLTAGGAVTVTVSAFDQFGNLATTDPGTVRITSTDPQTVLPANLLIGGRATFNVVLKTAGPQSLTIGDTSVPSTTFTQSATVTPAAASALTVSGPASTTAGTAQSYTVTARDPYGNLVTGYTGTVSFSSSDVQAGLPASYTFTAADAGSHTFTATLKTAGAQSITASDTANAAVSGTQAGIAVGASAAARFAVAGFPATTAGVAHTFTVTAFDAFGNLATGHTGTVNFGSSDVQAGLPASYTFTAADAGMHIFSATLKTAGSQSISVTDSQSPAVSGTQTGIAVTATTVVTHLGVAAPPTVTTGKSTAITVSALDAYGNVVVGYRGKVHFTDTLSANLPSDYTFGSSDNGVHVFSATFNTAGTQTLKVTDTANGAILGSVSITASAPVSGGGGGGTTSGGTTSGGGGGGGGSGGGGGTA